MGQVHSTKKSDNPGKPSGSEDALELPSGEFGPISRARHSFMQMPVAQKISAFVGISTFIGMGVFPGTAALGGGGGGGQETRAGSILTTRFLGFVGSLTGGAASEFRIDLSKVPAGRGLSAEAYQRIAAILDNPDETFRKAGYQPL